MIEGQPEAPEQAPAEPATNPDTITDTTGYQDPIAKEYRNELRMGRLVTKLKDVFRGYADAREQHIETMWDLSEKIYLGKDDEISNWPYAANYKINEVFRQVESQKAIASGMLFGQPKWFEFTPRVGGQENQANTATRIVHHQLKTLGLDRELFKWIHEIFKYGTGYLQYGWASLKRSKRKFTKVLDEDLKPGTVAYQKQFEELSHGGPFLEWVNPWKVYHADNVDDIADSPWTIIREPVSAEYLITQAIEGHFDENQVRLCLKNSNTLSNDFSSDNHLSSIVDADIVGNPEFELRTHYSNGGWCYTTVGEDMVVQARRNPFGVVPMFSIRNYQQAECAYGISEPWLLYYEQMLLRDVCSMWVDSIHYRLQPMFVVRESLRNQWEQTGFRPGATVFTDRPTEDVHPLPTTAGGFELQNSAEWVRKNMALETAMTDEVTGQGSRHRTAMGLMRLQEAAGARTELKIAQWEPIIREVYGTLYQLNAHYLNHQIALRVYGTDGAEAFGHYGPENFSGDVDVEVQLPRTMTPPAERQQKLLLFYQQVLQRPDLWNVEAIQEEMARAFEFVEPRRLIASPARNQEDALYENADFLATGFITPPLPQDNHQLHLKTHAVVTLVPQFGEKTPEEMNSFKRHIMRHQQFLAQLQAAGGMTGGAPPAGIGQEPVADTTSGAVRSEVTNRTEAAIGPGQMGAEQQGVLSAAGAQ